MGAVGAMAPTNFQRVAFGTHEFLMSMQKGTHDFFFAGTHILKFPTHTLLSTFKQMTQIF